MIQAKTYPKGNPLDSSPCAGTLDPNNPQAQPRKGLKDVIYGRRAKQLNLDYRVKKYPSPPPELQAVALKKQNEDISNLIGDANIITAPHQSISSSSVIMPSY